MITAKEAWKQSKNYCQYMDYMERIECEINKAVKKGLYLCEISIRKRTRRRAEAQGRRMTEWKCRRD